MSLCPRGVTPQRNCLFGQEMSESGSYSQFDQPFAEACHVSNARPYVYAAIFSSHILGHTLQELTMRLFAPQPLHEMLMNRAFVPTLDMVCSYAKPTLHHLLFPAHADNFDDDEDRALIAPEVD